MEKEGTVGRENNRDRIIVKTSIIGIVTNVLLASFKAVVGILANSIAVTLDAVNNLSDALSSIITIVGTKLAGRLPDKKHPLGYGRIEYLTAMLVAGIVLYAGLTSGVESVKLLFHPEDPDFAPVSLVIIAVAVAVKIVLGTYVKKKGQEVHSGSLVASGSDALFDAILSCSVLLSAIIFLLTGLSLEAFVGLLISVIIIRSGIQMMIETINEILGVRADRETTVRIKRLLAEDPNVRGAYDLVMYNYGPDRDYASVHLELPDTMTVREVDMLTRRLSDKVHRETGVVLVAAGVYSYNTKDDEAARIENDVRRIVLEQEGVIQLHGFYLDQETREMRFDAVLSFDIDANKGLAEICAAVQQAFPDYHVMVSPDVDVSD
ncbi:MAG: cation diffusion facilitator family transporter [Lachnospiraceae bacterium]|nr:cation diffusion facilitator family transporter [Lachnospiraceae bacterium]